MLQKLNLSVFRLCWVNTEVLQLVKQGPVSTFILKQQKWYWLQLMYWYHLFSCVKAKVWVCSVAEVHVSEGKRLRNINKELEFISSYQESHLHCFTFYIVYTQNPFIITSSSDCTSLFLLFLQKQKRISMDTLKKEAEKQVWAHCNLSSTYLPC